MTEWDEEDSNTLYHILEELKRIRELLEGCVDDDSMGDPN